jgi:hypothetical protein
MRTESRTRAVGRLLRVGFVVATLVVGVAGFGTTAYAQNQTARVNIDFGFVAAGKEMPAGVYDFQVVSGRVDVRSQNGQVSFMMPVLTRLGRHDTDKDPELIFDKVGDKLHLSEVWLPSQDGFLVLNTPVDHEHRVLGGSRPHK